MTGSASRERVVIIGASLAGSIAALSLAKAGVPVTLIDKESFPRRKPCGEGLSARGQGELSSVGLSLDTLGCSYSKLTGYRIFKGERSLHIQEKTGLIGVPRVELDQALLERVRRLPSARVLLGDMARVCELSERGCAIRVGEQRERGGTLIIAEGANSPTLRSLGMSLKSPRSPRVGTSSAWRVARGAFEPCVHTFLVPGGEIYLTPLGGDRVNVSVLGSRDLIQSVVHERGSESRIAAMAANLGVELSLESPFLSCGAVNTRYRATQYCGAFVVGDACETFDPCAGFGMTHALMTGRLVGACILEALGSSDRNAALIRYHRERETLARDVRGFTRLTSTTMGSRIGRMSLPFFVSTGLAEMVSESVHGGEKRSLARGMVSLVGVSLA